MACTCKIRRTLRSRAGRAILIDIGSTTTDIIPIVDGRVAAVGLTDKDRLASGELVYSGVERTSLSAIVTSLPYRGAMIPVAAELFATTRDVYLTLGDLAEDANCSRAANGKPATREAARGRLARMLCVDRDEFNDHDARIMAEEIQRQQIAKITAACTKVVDRFPGGMQLALTSGQGEFLACRVIGPETQIVSLSKILGPAVSHSAPAHALAILAREAKSMENKLTAK